jgi:Fusaric acid resistance protein-like
MNALNASEQRLAGLARSVRAAIIVPSLFAMALLVINQPELAGFAVFGTFAHLVMVDYDTTGKTRTVEAAMLTVLGAVAVSLGTLVSENVLLSVGGAIAAGFLTELAAVMGGRIAVIRTALLLSFMLAVAVPASISSVPLYLGGWLLAGIVAQPALLLLWLPLQKRDACESTPNSFNPGNDRSSWIANAAGTGAAMGLAVLLTRILKVDHAFWVVLGVLPVLNANRTSTARTFWEEQAGTLIGFLAAGCLVAIIGSHHWYWVALIFLVFASTYASTAVGFIAGQAGFTVFAVVLFCILLPRQGNVGIVRIEDIALGGVVSLIAGLLRQLGSVALQRQTFFSTK